MPKPLEIYLRTAYAYSLLGCSAKEIYASVETNVQLEPVSEVEAKAHNRYSLQSLSNLQRLDRLQAMIKIFCKDVEQYLPSNTNSHNARVWLHLPAEETKNSPLINAYHVTTLLHQACPVLCELDFRASEDIDSLRQAINYLHQREDIQYLFYLSLDSHLAVDETEDSGEAISLLVLQKSEEAAKLKISLIDGVEKSFSVEAFQCLKNKQHQIFVQVDKPSEALSAMNYSIEKQYLSGKFTQSPKPESCQQVTLYPHVGENSTALSLGVMYILGRSEFGHGAANDACLLAKFSEKLTQCYSMTRCS